MNVFKGNNKTIGNLGVGLGQAQNESFWFETKGDNSVDMNYWYI